MKPEFNPPRPLWSDQGFAEECVHEFIKEYFPDYYIEGADRKSNPRNGMYESLIEEFHLYSDTSELYKTLIKYHHWEFDPDDWEKINEFDFFVGKKLKEREKKWVNENNIQPPFPIGSKVKLPSHYKDLVGVIVGVYEHEPARYVVQTESQAKWNKEKESLGSPERINGHVLKYESVELLKVK